MAAKRKVTTPTPSKAKPEPEIGTSPLPGDPGTKAKAETHTLRQSGPIGGAWKKGDAEISVNIAHSRGVTFWLKGTEKAERGMEVLIPLPVRLIKYDKNGAGCIVVGAHGDAVAIRENVLDVLGQLDGIPLDSVSTWSLAG